MSILQNIIPVQTAEDYIGARSNFHAESRHEALVLFNEAKLRLLDINNWTKLCNGKHSEFFLTDKHGVLLQTSVPSVGDLIRIRLPIPSNSMEERFSWVRIEHFESRKDLLKDEEMFGFCVRSVNGPVNNMDTDHTHVYNSEVISYFLIYRKASTIMAVEREKNSRASTPSLFKKLGYAIIDFLSVMRFSQPKWKKLVNGVLKPSFS